MGEETRGRRVHERWAHLRFSVIGQLLAAPPDKGELKAAIEGLAARTWRHPTTGEPVCFGFSTIERWYYPALRERADPVTVLRRKLRADAGQQPAVGEAVRRAVLAQYAAHKSWSVKLHHDNLVAGRGAARPRARAVLSHAAPLHESQRPRQAPAPRPPPDGRGRAGRGAPRRARGPPIRGRVRQRPAALGLPPRVAQGSHIPRRVGDADPVRRARRSLAPRLPSPMVSVRDRRGDRARPRPGVSEAWPAARGLERQRLGHDGGRDQRRPRAPRRPAPHDPALFTLPVCGAARYVAQSGSSAVLGGTDVFCAT